MQLPIQAVVPAVRAALAGAGRCLLSAPPGSGKTTWVPLELLHEPWLAGQRILMLEPRRLAARASAARMAELLGEPLGRQVGYQVRFDRRLSPHTRIEVLTEGLLTRRLQQDPTLEGVGLIVFDEFHERSLEGDLALALCLDIADGLREELRLLVMSATLDLERIAPLLGDAPVVRGEGRSHPVACRYLERMPEKSIVDTAHAGIRRALREQAGDLLVFLPGSGEIRALEQRLQPLADSEILVCPLYGDLPLDRQLVAIRPDPGGRRRIVLSTSIAETSLTIEGINTVVDSGWSRQPRFDPNSGLTRLETRRLSLASAEQRAGRAGRLQPGVCYRLWTLATQSGLNPYTVPEILTADLAPLVLQLAQWGVGEVTALQWLDAPPGGAVAQARALLQGLGALDGKGRITAHGRRMAELPLHPRLAHMLLLGAGSGQVVLAAEMAALISERDILRRQPGTLPMVDIEERLRLLDRWRSDRRGAAAGDPDPAACRRVEQVSRQLQRLMKPYRGATGSPPLTVGALLGSAYPERIARRRSPEGRRYLMVSGRGVQLPEGDPLGREAFLVVAHLDAGRAEGRVFLAAAIDVEQIRGIAGSRIAVNSEIVWEISSRAVRCREKEMLGAVVLFDRPLEEPDPEAVARALLEGIRSVGVAALPWNRESRDWQARLLSLRAWQPAAGWPDVSDEGLMACLDAWLPPWLQGITRLEQLRKLDLTGILRGLLDWEQSRRMERLAPTHLRVPSGSRVRLEYRPGEPPLLKVRLQEMFGQAETPSVCDRQVPVMLHLLSPARRPVQVTMDLKGFWERTYPEVKRELKGRYPKHYWPDDPWSATPTARVKPRR